MGAVVVSMWANAASGTWFPPGKALLEAIVAGALLNEALADGAFVDATLLPRLDGSIAAELRPLPVEVPARMNILRRSTGFCLNPGRTSSITWYWFSCVNIVET